MLNAREPGVLDVRQILITAICSVPKQASGKGYAHIGRVHGLGSKRDVKPALFVKITLEKRFIFFNKVIVPLLPFKLIVLVPSCIVMPVINICSGGVAIE